jgi:thiol-disulfide isomerase/thioredoxin/DsbC/DsbD-like thiol-disulfide interchange protein
MRPSRLLCLALALLVPVAALAQGLRPTPRLEAVAAADGAPAGATTLLALRVTLPAGYHVQSNAPRDPALVPTLLTLTPPAGVTIAEIVFPKAEDLKQAGQAQPLAVFGPEFVIGVRLVVAANAAPGPVELRGKLRYQACDDKVCYTPVTTDVSWNVRVVPAGTAVAAQNGPIFAQLAAASAPASAPVAGTDLVAAVRAANTEKDFARGEKLVADHRAANGITPVYLLAHSWLGRGALAAGELDRAEAYARETYAMGLAELRRRPMDQEAQFPTAFGAAIEVLGQVQAARGARSEAVAFLTEQMRVYGDTSIAKRIQKNLNLVSLEGAEAPALDLAESQGVPPPTLAALKGKVVLLFFWAHWCGDCKAQGPALEQLLAKYGARGLTVIAPTQRYGYVAGGAPAGRAEEASYIAQVRRVSYPWLESIPVPLSETNHLRYGVSTTPTLVLVGRDGLVKLYRPGKLTEAELDAAIRPLL